MAMNNGSCNQPAFGMKRKQSVFLLKSKDILMSAFLRKLRIKTFSFDNNSEMANR
jgi:hypothetical protein